MSLKILIKTEFKELKPLQTAFMLLGWTIEKGVVARGWGETKPREMVARNPLQGTRQAPDLIIEKKANNTGYDVHTSLDRDYANRAFQSLGGRGLTELKKKYAVESIRQKAIENGDEISVTELENGTTEVTVNGN